MDSRLIVRSIPAFATLLFLAVATGDAAAGGLPRNHDSGHGVPLMTQNLYLGADVTPIFNATDLPSLVAAVTAAWQQVQASDIPARATKIADEIAQTAPDLVALQEAVQWSGPGPDGSPIQYDFLQSILGELSSRGAQYAAVGVIDNLAISFPIGLVPIQVVDRDAILARTDLPSGLFTVANITSAHFSNLFTVQTLLGPVTVPRGWISADVNVGGPAFRLVETHLESFDATVQEKQAGELVSGPANTALPVLLAGDFNSNANGKPNLPDDTPTYNELRDDGFSDVWTLARRNPGNTCCEAPDLLNFPPDLTERLDLMLFNGGLDGAFASLVGDHNPDRVSTPVGPLWPSDHAGLIATIKIP